MKKMISLFLVLMMLSGSTAVFAQEPAGSPLKELIRQPEQNVLFTDGKVSEIRGGRILVEGTGFYKKIELNVTDATHVVAAEDGSPVAVETLKAGDAVVAYYGPRVTRSLIPQGNAMALVVGLADNGSRGMYVKAAEVAHDRSGAVMVLAENRDRIITISHAVLDQNDRIRKGSELIVWYGVMTMSMPGQAHATKAVLLPEQVKVHLGAGVVAVNGQEVQMDGDDAVAARQAAVMMPLQPIAEALGYVVSVNEETYSVEVRSGGGLIKLNLGSRNCGTPDGDVEMAAAPAFAGSKVYVPADFFTKVLKVKLSILDDPI